MLSSSIALALSEGRLNRVIIFSTRFRNTRAWIYAYVKFIYYTYGGVRASSNFSCSVFAEFVMPPG